MTDHKRVAALIIGAVQKLNPAGMFLTIPVGPCWWTLFKNDKTGLKSTVEL